MNDTLTIYETFSSIQGESTHAGRLCFFIRLAGCNLRCSYCDTRKAQTVSSGRIRSLDELVDEAERSGLRLIEITGGEPMLQPATPELCRRLLERGFEVLMETNGSVDLSAVPRGVRRIIDWKTPFSGESGKMLDGNFLNLRPGDEVKFVIAGRNDYDAALEVIRRFRITEHATILFAPVFGEIEPHTLVEWMLADRVPARLNLQLHKVIWNPDAEGV